ncbi:MAG: DUF2238 domain-containing protein [Nanoarchaeota archaeon]
MKTYFSKNYPAWLFCLYLIVFAFASYKPNYISDYILESSLSVAFLLFLFFTRNKLRLSNISYTLIFVFLVLHTIGAHYTYSEVPYNSFFEKILGFNINEFFGFERNHYDRLVHFCFGLFLAYPIRELFMRVANARGFWGYYLPFDVTASFSAIYELIEWMASVVFGGELGIAYLGAQGDIWDAQKDMALAIGGAIIAMLITFFVNLKYKKDFSKDFTDSFKIKRKAPLGEVEIAKMIKKSS